MYQTIPEPVLKKHELKLLLYRCLAKDVLRTAHRPHKMLSWHDYDLFGTLQLDPEIIDEVQRQEAEA